MVGFVTKFFQHVSVVEEGDFVVVTCPDVRRLMQQVYKQWSTSRIEENMFSKVRMDRLVFYKFFAADFLYMLRKLREKRARWINVRLLDRLILELAANTWLSQTELPPKPWLHWAELKQLNYPPLPEQLEFFKVYERATVQYNLKGYVLGADPGTGKTFACLALSTLIKPDVSIEVVPKNTVREVWVPHLESMFKTTPKFWASDTGDWPPPKGCQHYVVHYEALEAFSAWAKKQSWRKVAILLDESHRFNELTAQRTLTFIDFCLAFNDRHVVWSSGTPFKALGSEAIPMMRTIDDLFNPKVADRFKAIFGKSSSKGLDILAARIGLLTYRVDGSKLINEPEVYSQPVQLDNGTEYTLEAIKAQMRAFVKERLEYYQKNRADYLKDYRLGIEYYEQVRRKGGSYDQEYRQYKDRFAMISKGYDPMTMGPDVVWVNNYEKTQIIPLLPKHLKEPFKDARSVIKYVSLKVLGEALGQVLGRTRTECHLDMVPHSNLEEWIDSSESKTVIFTSYVPVAKATFDWLVEKGYKPAIVYADTNADLNRIRSDFEKDPDLNPLVATFQSLSTGVPLTQASTLVMLNSPFRDHERKQTVARVARLGQQFQVRIVDVLLDTGTEPNISTRSKDILDWSRQQVEIIMGVKAPDIEVAMESVGLELLQPTQPVRTGQTPVWSNW